MIDRLTGAARGSTRDARLTADIRPHVAQIDTTAAEFPAVTNYLYSTYHASQSETRQQRHAEDHDSRLRRVPDRLERRIRLVLRQRSPGRAGGRLRDDHGQLQPGNGQHRLRHLHDAAVRRDQPGVRRRGLREGTARGRGRQHGRPACPTTWQSGWRRWASRCSAPAPPTSTAPRIARSSARCSTRLGIEQPRWAPLTEVSDAEALVGRARRLPGARAAELCPERRGHERRARAARAAAPFSLAPSASHRITRSSSRSSRPHAREIEIDAVADKGKHRAVGHLRAHRECRRAQRRRHHGAAAPDALPADDSPRPADCRRACERTGHHRPVQRAVHRQEQRRQGDRMQSARVAQPAVRQQGSWRQFRRRGDAPHAWRGRRASAAIRSISIMSASRRRCSRSGACTAPTRCRASRWRAPARSAASPATFTKPCCSACCRPRSASRPRACCCLSARPRRSSPSRTRRWSFATSCKLPIFATAGTADALLDLGIEATRVGKSPDDRRQRGGPDRRRSRRSRHQHPAPVRPGRADPTATGSGVRPSTTGVPLLTDLHLAKGRRGVAETYARR